jgi:hypothetical protein
MSIFRSFFVGEGFESKKPITMGPGKQYTVRNVDQVKEFSVSPPPPDIYRLFEQFDSFTNRIIGNLDQSDTTGINTATEARLVYSRSAGTFQDYVNFNRENFLRRLIFLWIELNQQFLTVDDIRGLVPEDELDKIGFEDKKLDITAQYGFWVTGEKNLEDRQTQLDKIQIFGTLMQQIENMPPQIDRDKLVKRVVHSLDMGDDIIVPIEEQNGDINNGVGNKKGKETSTATKEQIGKDLAVLAQNQGMSADQLLQTLSQKFGTTPDEIILGMESLGSVSGFLQEAAKTLSSPPQIPEQK